MSAPSTTPAPDTPPVEAGAAAAAAQAAADARQLGQDPAPPAPHRVDPDAGTEPTPRQVAAADARAAVAEARALLRAPGGVGDLEAAAQLVGDEGERGDRRALHALGLFDMAEVTVTEHSVEGPGAILRSLNLSALMIDELDKAAKTEREALAKVDGDDLLSPKGKAAAREAIRAKSDRSEAHKAGEKTMQQLDTRLAALARKWKAAGDAKPVEPVELAAGDLLRLASMDEDRLGDLVVSLAGSGRHALALALLDGYELVASDATRLQRTAHRVTGRSGAVARAALLESPERVGIAAEAARLRGVRNALAELVEDARRKPGEVELLRQRHRKVFDKWSREK